MIKKTRFLIVCLLLILAGLYINLHSDIEVSLNKSFKGFPMEYKGWHMISESQFSDDVLNVLRPTDYMLREYIGTEGVPVTLYIGYHGGGKDSGPIHSPRNCLPGSGWYLVSEEKMTVQSGLKEIALVKAVYQKGAYKEIFFYWFDVKGQSLSNEFALKFAKIKNSVLYRRRDAAFIRVSVDVESDEEMSFLVGEKFIKDFYPVIVEFLPD
jgi:EpsI family protein